MRRLNILFVSQYIPKPDIAAGDLRLFSIIEMLVEHHQTDFYATELESESDYAQYKMMLSRINVEICPTGRYGLELALNQRLYDIVIFEFWLQAFTRSKIVIERQPWAKLIIDSVDVHFLREEAALSIGKMDEHIVEYNKHRELGSYRQVDGVIVVTKEDKQALEFCGGMPPIHTIPIVLRQKERTSFQRNPGIVFVGGFNHPPNIDAVEWFVSDIWPLVKSKVPEAKLTVIGSNPTPQILSLAALEGVHITGYVSETASFLESAALSVAPLRYGAGMKGKVVEAMMAALPVITTSIGAQGFGAVSGEHCLIADNASDFAAAIVQLLNDPDRSENIGKAGQRLIAGICGPEIVSKQLQEMLDAVVENQPIPRPTVKWMLYICIDHLRGALWSIARLLNLKRLRDS